MPQCGKRYVYDVVGLIFTLQDARLSDNGPCTVGESIGVIVSCES
jgi:hypothetical protein